MKYITWQTKLRVILIEALFIGFLAVVLINSAAYLFSLFSGLPQENWALLGRWINMIAHGQFMTPSISIVPGSPYDQAIGKAMHLLISFAFSLVYLLISIQHFIRKIHPLISGILFGLTLMVFPLLIEYPSMGLSVFSPQTPYITLGFIKIFTCHSFFGIGLGLGRLCLEYIRNAHVSISVV